MSRILENKFFRLRAWLAEPFNQGVLLFFGLALFLVYPLFFPNLVDLGPYDEMILINGGRSLVEGNWPTFAYNPLVGLLYGLAYLPFQQDPFWILQIATIGRMVLFSLLWWSAYAVARSLRSQVHPYLPLGALLIAGLQAKLLHNPSDALFAAMLAFALAQALSFVQDGMERHLWQASVFFGLSALSRSDGVVAGAVFLGLACVWIVYRRGPWLAAGKRLLACILPFVLLTGGYILFQGAVSGEFDIGLARRSYLAFEQGHVATPGVDADVRKVYGSEDGNHFSILNAIRNNPPAFAARVQHNISRMLELALQGYDKRLAAVFLLFGLRGVWELLRRRQYALLIVLLAGPVYLLVYLITFFREGYLLQPYAVLLALAGIGAGCLPADLEHPRRRWLVWGSFLLVCLYGLVDNKLAIFAGAAAFLVGIFSMWLVLPHLARQDMARRLSFVALLCAGMVVHGEYPSPAFRTLGENSEEQAVMALRQALPPHAHVLAAVPGPALAAKMQDVWVMDGSIDVHTPQELMALLKELDAQAIYVEPNFCTQAPELWAVIRSLEGQGLERIFQIDPGSIQIFRVAGS